MRLGVPYGFWPPKHESEVILNFYRVVFKKSTVKVVIFGDFSRNHLYLCEISEAPFRDSPKIPPDSCLEGQNP